MPVEASKGITKVPVSSVDTDNRNSRVEKETQEKEQSGSQKSDKTVQLSESKGKKIDVIS